MNWFKLLIFIYLIASVRYMEVTIAKLPEMIMYMKMDDRNSNSGWSSRLKVLKFINEC